MSSSQTKRATGTLTLAHNLAIIRVATGWTQQALADAAGVSRATIAQLEAGLGDPRLSTVEQIARAVEVTPSVLLLATPDVEMLVRARQSAGATFNVSASVQEMLKLLVVSGQLRHMLEAARIVLDLAGEADTAQTVGMALGAARGGAAGAAAVGALVQDSPITTI